MSDRAVLGVDPGTHKCGLALLDPSGQVLHRDVVTLEELPQALREVAVRGPLAGIALGDRTGARPVRLALERTLPQVPLILVPEHRTSEEARRLYWQYHPPRGWRRLVPRGLLLPPHPVDGFAAEILARRLLASLNPD